MPPSSDGSQSGTTGTSLPVAMTSSIRDLGKLTMPRPAQAASTRMVWRLTARPILGRTIARVPRAFSGSHSIRSRRIARAGGISRPCASASSISSSMIARNLAMLSLLAVRAVDNTGLVGTLVSTGSSDALTDFKLLTCRVRLPITHKRR